MSNAKFRGGRTRAALIQPTMQAPEFMQPALPAGKWIVHWRRFGLALCGLLFLALAASAPVFISSCMSTREAPINDKATGAALYVGDDGKATTEKTDAKGNPRERATIPVSTGETENTIEGARSLTGMLPGPFGFVADALLSVGLIAGGVAYKIQRRKRLEELGLTEEVIEIADEDESARKKLTNAKNPKVQEKVAQVRRKRSAQPA